jgi:hypothetical protein
MIGHLSYYFFLLAGLMSIALAVFLYLSSGYVYANAQVLDALALATSDATKNSVAASANSDDVTVNVCVEPDQLSVSGLSALHIHDRDSVSSKGFGPNNQ